ncbi:MAG TPA: aminotransferase class III-fold pyridoxal phosphate-dependent enzyme, partial [Longimicrobium sp.]|nr:aminotransferase class III-fold pyridoxal phosphate-dependent enzyme [Longimicrobium sp.]
MVGVTGTTGDGAAATGTLQDVVAMQIALMHAQIEMLRGAGGPAPAIPAAVSAMPVFAAPAVAPTGPTTQAAPVQSIATASVTVAPPSAAGLGGTATVAVRAGAPAVAAEASHGPHRPVRMTMARKGELTDEQKRHFAALVERYTARTRKSKEYAAANRPHLSDNRASLGFRLATKELMYPIVGKRSQGTRLWDVDGNEYVDFTIGFGVHFFGHRAPFIIQAVEEQLASGLHTGPQSDLAGPTAALFAELTGMERVTFCNTGSEAVMTALRIARTVTGRTRIVQFEGSYHGCFDGILARTAPGTGGDPAVRPVAAGTPQGMIEDVVVLPYGTPEALEWIRANADTLAAVLVEPVQSNYPENQPREFLHEVRAVTERSGTALVFDEMITGLRLGIRGAQGWYGIDADIATYGKVIGGGFPLGVVAGKARWMDAIDGGQWSYGDDSFPAADQTFFAGTFCKHPVVMAAAQAVLRHLQACGPALYEELHARAARLVASMRQVLEEERVPIRILHTASLFRFAFRPEDAFVELIFYHMLERGIYVWEGRGCFVSPAHTDEDCDRMVQALRESIRALRAGGFLSGPDGGGSSTPAESVGSTELAGAASAAAEGPVAVALTPAQRQVWVHAQLGDDASRAYNEQFVIGLRGRVDEDALRAAVADLARHHGALRTVFDPAGEVQHVRSAPPEPLPVFVHAPEGGADDAALREALDRGVREVFDLASGPLFRVYVHGARPDRHVLQFVVHHAIADGLGTDILRRDLETAYAARLAGSAPILPPAMQFAEYAALLAEHASQHREAEAAWLERFASAAPPALPTDRPRPRFPSHEAEQVSCALSSELTARLRELGRRQGCTLFMTLLGGVLATLHRVADQDDLVVGISSAGRPFPGADTLVGHCVDVLPVRSAAAGDMRGAAFLRVLKGALLDAYEHETFSYARLAQAGSVARGPGVPPLISVTFNLEPGGGGDHGPRTFAGIPVEPVRGASTPFTKFDLTIDAVDQGDAIQLVFLFNRGLFDRATVQRLMSQVSRVLEQLADDADRPLTELVLIGEDERRMVVEEWNRTEAAFPAEVCIHELFQAQAQAAPDAVAVTFGGASLSFGELDTRSNQLAHHLVRLGVGPEVRVGICLERSLEMVVSLLAVLKAGGAYVPLDPAYPAERLAFMLADSATSVLLTQEKLRGLLVVEPGVHVVV